MKRLIFVKLGIAFLLLAALHQNFSSLSLGIANPLFSSDWENSGGWDVYDDGRWTTIWSGYGWRNWDFGPGPGSLSVSSTQKYQGNYSLKSSPTGDWAFVLVAKIFDAPQSTLYAKANVLVTTLPEIRNSSIGLLYIRNSDYSLAMLDVDIHLGMIDGPVWTLGYFSNSANENFQETNTPTISANTWYTVECGVHVGSNGEGWVRTWITPAGQSYSESLPTHLATDISNSEGSVQSFSVGGYTPPTELGVDVFVDNVIVSTSFIGPTTTTPTPTPNISPTPSAFSTSPPTSSFMPTPTGILNPTPTSSPEPTIDGGRSVSPECLIVTGAVGAIVGGGIIVVIIRKTKYR